MPESQQSASLEISTGIAQIYKDSYGRGPTRITTHVVEEAVICLLRHVNTPAQASLVDAGKAEVAADVHGQLQRTMEDEMTALVEQITGRTVSGYVPGFNATFDATTDVFLLEPAQE